MSETTNQTETKPDPFDNAEMYDCCDSEEINHENWVEAIEEMVDGYLSPGCDVAKIIHEIGDIVVTGYVRRKVEMHERRSWAESALKGVAEAWCEEYGTPDGDDWPSEENFEKAKPHVLAAIEVLLSGMHVWACEDSGKRTFSADEIEEMMRKYREDWFEGEAVGKT